MSSAFVDADGDSLSYSAVSSNTAVVTVGVSGTKLSVSAVSVGSASVSVTASDSYGLSATHAISVTVNARNRAPVAVGSIAARTLTVGGSAVSIDLGDSFSDPDGDSLSYTAPPPIPPEPPRACPGRT